MKTLKNKTKTALTALFLMLTITITAIPFASTHTPPWNIPTNAYVALSPSTVGVGQYVTIVVWVDRYSPTAGGGAGQRWNGFKIDITKPDGSNVTIGPWYCASDVGSDAKVFVPDVVGTYRVIFSWPGETAAAMPGLPSTSANIGDFYQGSTSEPAYLTVQQEPITSWQEPPLPTDFWTTPINAANRGWSQLASNWLKGSWLVDNWQRWGTAPESPHVLWATPMAPGGTGGINDAQWPGIPSNVNDYETPFSAPIIMNGKVYYNSPPVSDSDQHGYYCRDLYTGEIVWYKNGSDNGLNNPYTIGGSYDLGQNYLSLTQGWLYHYYSVNGQGILAYLIMVDGTTWYFLDAATGNFMLKLINVPSGTAVTDQDGNLLRYSYNTNTGNLLCWNVSQAIPPLGPLGTNQQQWKMRLGATIDAVNDSSWTAVGPTSTTPAIAIRPRSGYTMNVTIAKGLPGSITAILQNENRVPKLIFGSYLPSSGLGSPITGETLSAWVVSIDEHVTAFSPNPDFSATQNNNLGFGATLQWYKNITVPITGKNYTWSIIGANYDSKVFFLSCKQTRQRFCYSLETGELLWQGAPEATENFWGLSGNVYYGTYLGMGGSFGHAGMIYAYDPASGKLLWTYNATAVGYESAYGDNMPISIAAVADKKVYLYTSEHSLTKPLWHGSYLRCVNITDGTEAWKLLCQHQGLGIADGYIVVGNAYDNQIYCIGKGPSATTVSAPQMVPALGSSVMITGTVTDQSPGAKERAWKMGYANEVPAVSDESQQAWMEYIYEQQAKPSNATGVPVSLDAIDPNSNYIHIGTVTTTTVTGQYGCEFTPEVPGTYHIIATFAGSKSYGSSTSDTYLAVGEPAATASPFPAVVSPPTETYIVGGVIAVIIAIAVVGAVIILVLRKRP